MAVKFSQFLAEALNSNSYLVGYNSSTSQNVRVSYTDLVNAFVGGSGTTNYVSKWTSSTTLGNSRIFDNGTQIGIGTTSPPTDAGFQIVGINSNTSGSYIALMRNGTAQFRLLTSSTGNGVSGLTNLPMTFETNSSERMRIFGSTGNISIGYGGSPTDGGYKVDISGTLRSTGDANINGLTVGKGGGSVSTNTAVGVSAILGTATGTNNTAIGYFSSEKLIGGTQNTSVGAEALQLNVSGVGNTAVGFRAAESMTGSYSVAVGYASIQPATGDRNTAIGYGSGLSLTTGGRNTFVGFTSGDGITTGSNNTIIGNVTGLSASLSNTIILADGQGNQRLYINSSGNVGIGTTSPQANHLLTLQSSGASNQISLALRGYDNSNAGGLRFISNDGTSFDYYIFGNTTNGITFGTSSSTYVQSINFSTGTSGLFLGNSTALYIRGAASRDLNLGSNNTNDRMIIKSGGNVLIGTTTDAGYRLDISGTARVSGVLTVGTMTITGTATNQIAIGGSTTGNSSVAVGTASTAALQSIAIGEGANASQNSIAIGRSATTNAQGQVVFGGANNASNDIYFGRGITATTVENIKIQPNGASGTDIAGGHFTLTGGRATGNALSGDLIFQTSDATTSGTTLQSLTTKMILKGNGSVGIGTTSPNASALLDLTSTTKGLLLMRMTGTEAEAISTPADGLVVYINNGNGTTITSTGFWGRDAGAWVKLN